MGLGSTAKKIQELADVAEKLYRQLKDVRERMTGLENDLQTTAERVSEMELEQRRQRALLEAVAEDRGVDVESVLEDVESELSASDVSEDGGPGDGSSPEDADASADAS